MREGMGGKGFVMEIKRVCVLDSMYTLLQYLLLSEEDEILATYFFFRGGLSENVVSFFKNQSSRVCKFNYGFIRDVLFYYIVIPFKYPFLFKRKFEYWGVDNLGYEKFIIRKNKFHLLEDGLLSYNEIPYTWEKMRFIWLKKFLMGPLAGPRKYVGEENTCVCRHLTGLVESRIIKDNKTKIDSLDSLWKKSSGNKRNLINRIYNVAEVDFLNLKKCKRILFTQPLSEDGYISEDEKIQLYKRILTYINTTDKIVVKPHPREKTDYLRFFDNIIVLDSKIPFELLSLNGLQFSEVYTIFSTCVFSIPYMVNVYFFGSQIHPRIGEIFKDNHYGKVKSPSEKNHLMDIDLDKFAEIQV